MDKWDIRFYKNNRGDDCVGDFIRKQDKITKSKIAKTIDLVCAYGPNLGLPHSRNMKNGLYELRIMGKNNVRIFYILKVEKIIYFLHGFKKKTKSTPRNEIDIARKRQKELTNYNI